MSLVGDGHQGEFEDCYEWTYAYEPKLYAKTNKIEEPLQIGGAHLTNDQIIVVKTRFKALRND